MALISRESIYDFVLVGYCKYSSILYHFWVIWHWVISWPWNLGRGHSRSFKPVSFESLGVVSNSPSIVTMALSCIICEIKRDIGRKSWFFFIPPLHSTPPFGGGAPRRNIAIPFGVGKLHRVSKKTLHFCFCQNFVKFPRILINVGR